jgi:hypothetical protein
MPIVVHPSLVEGTGGGCELRGCGGGGCGGGGVFWGGEGGLGRNAGGLASLVKQAQARMEDAVRRLAKLSTLTPSFNSFFSC